MPTRLERRERELGDGMNVQQNIRGVEEVKAYLQTVPRGTVRVGTLAIAEYIVGDQSHGLKHYPPYKHVTRKKAYGKSFVSDKQRRFVMAMITEGRIDPGAPHRTGKTQRGWKVVSMNNGYKVKVSNKEPGAIWTADDEQQARLNAMVGWRKMAQVIEDNIAGAIRHANAEISKWLKG